MVNPIAIAYSFVHTEHLVTKINELVCALNALELAATDSQQLKAEIAYYVNHLESDYRGGVGVNINSVIDFLRQLSAV